MSVDEVKEQYKHHLEGHYMSGIILIDVLRFLVNEAELLDAIRKEADDFFNEEIDYSDFGERVSNLL